MAKVFLICGKICSGKGFYTRQLKEKEHAVVLSCDEIENDLFHHDLGDRRDAISADIKAYLHKKAVDIALKCPQKVRQYSEVKIVQAAERACCL